jgi:transcriptional regulator with XRE-family HTH domain
MYPNMAMIRREAQSDFGRWLKGVRRLSHVTQERLAEITGFDQGRISKYENGRVIPPSIEIVKAIAQAIYSEEPSIADDYETFEADAIRAAWPTGTENEDWLDELSREAGFDNSETIYSPEERAQIKREMAAIARGYLSERRRRQ